jgi:hypothetical protein
MKATNLWSGALLLAGVAASLAHAQPCSPALNRPYAQAPDACGPGFYWTCPNGTVYGPNYYLRPAPVPYMPLCPPGQAPQYPNQPGFGQPGPLGYPGLPGLPGLAGHGQRPTAIFPTHPFARSPREFFMVDD